jgi:hypothetical protein
LNVDHAWSSLKISRMLGCALRLAASVDAEPLASAGEPAVASGRSAQSIAMLTSPIRPLLPLIP